MSKVSEVEEEIRKLQEKIRELRKELVGREEERWVGEAGEG